MRFRIKNWKLSILAIIFICIFTSLGIWQLTRAQQKNALFAAFHARTKAAPLFNQDLQPNKDVRFYIAHLNGEFDNAHTFLLDNKIFQGKVGYEVYTPFKLSKMNLSILVDRGFVPLEKNRETLPTIPTVLGKVEIKGMLNSPPRYVALGALTDKPVRWPLRVEYIDLPEIETLLKYPLFSYVLNLKAEDKTALPIEWQIVTVMPERHLGYAIQWFALALTLLILFVALNCDRSR